jgi:hypothetical protein
MATAWSSEIISVSMPRIARARADQLQAVEFALRRGQHQAPVRMQSARLAGQLLDLAVEVDRVLLQPRDVRLAVERVHATGRVPGRADVSSLFSSSSTSVQPIFAR